MAVTRRDELRRHGNDLWGVLPCWSCRLRFLREAKAAVRALQGPRLMQKFQNLARAKRLALAASKLAELCYGMRGSLCL